ncbi:MAG: RNA polymerase sigma factor, partial [Tepidisphaeraceae bacterium]
ANAVPALRSGQELLAEFERTGAEEAFKEIVRQYAGMVYSVCYQVTKDNHDAEDATQAVFLALAVHSKTKGGVRFLGPWLRQVAKRTALDIRKAKKRRLRREEENGRLQHDRMNDLLNGNGNGNGRFSHPTAEEELRHVLRGELDKLPAKYRMPLILHYFGGLKAEETARELGCKTRTLAVRMHRARKMLAESLGRRGIFVSGDLLGLALIAVVQSMVSDSLMDTTARAAADYATGHVTTSLISANIMSIARTSGRAMVLGKIKFAAAIALACGTALAGGVQALNHFTPYKLQWFDSLKLKTGDLLRPLLRSLVSPIRPIASATAKADPPALVEALPPSIASVTPALSPRGTPGFETVSLPVTNGRIVMTGMPAAPRAAGSLYIARMPAAGMSVDYTIPTPISNAAPSRYLAVSSAALTGGVRVSAPGAESIEYNPAGSTHVVEWDSDPDDLTIDSPNSVRLTLRGMEDSGTVQVAYLSADGADVPTLPTGHRFIGVWRFDATSDIPGGVDLAVRYDDMLAAKLGLDESSLKLWIYDNGWRRITDSSFARDLNEHILYGHTDALTYFAVSAPEPTGVLMLTTLAGTFFARRRRS